MKRTHKNYLLGGIALALLVSSVATATAYVTREHVKASSVKAEIKKPVHKPRIQASNAQQPQPAPRCDDRNILGYVAGGAAGGILGNQIGNGSGKTMATIGGTLGGAYLGGQYIPLRNATCL